VGRSSASCWTRRLALFVGGAAWMVVLTTISSVGQLVLPAWVRGRAMAMFLLIFFGGQAFGSVLWGSVATSASLRTSLLISAALLVAAGGAHPSGGACAR
jgi:hypothetical protein